MCGLFGWFGQSNQDKKRMEILATALMIGNDKRGGDAWGYYDGKAIYKGLKDISEFVDPGELARETFIMAHTRYGTTGAKTKVENAHPFDIQCDKTRIVGAHNGMVSNHWELKTRYHRTNEVDSEHIFLHIGQGLPLREIEAYGAITYEHEGALYLGRFNSGELSIALAGGRLIWSSESKLLRQAIHLAGLRVKFWYTLKDGQRYRIGQNTVLYKEGHLPFQDYEYMSTGTSGAVYEDWDNYVQKWRDGNKTTIHYPRLNAGAVSPLVTAAQTYALQCKAKEDETIALREALRDPDESEAADNVALALMAKQDAERAMQREALEAYTAKARADLDQAETFKQEEELILCGPK